MKRQYSVLNINYQDLLFAINVIQIEFVKTQELLLKLLFEMQKEQKCTEAIRYEKILGFLFLSFCAEEVARLLECGNSVVTKTRQIYLQILKIYYSKIYLPQSYNQVVMALRWILMRTVTIESTRREDCYIPSNECQECVRDRRDFVDQFSLQSQS